MNIIIIEDEKPAARLLQRKVEKLGLQVTQMLHSVEEAIEISHQYEIVLNPCILLGAEV